MTTSIDRDDWDCILGAVAAVRGVDLRRYRVESVERGIAARLDATRARSVAEYVELLRAGGDEADELLRAVVVSVTGFFRDARVFEALRAVVIPSLVRHADRALLRGWAIGVATGEEAWSLAMLLEEACEHTRGSWQLLASDVEPGALAHAARGRYGALDDIPPDLRQRFIVDGAIGPVLRERVHFECHDAVGTRLAPPGAVIATFALVCLRNVLIYLQRDLQQELLERLASILEPGGVLVLGPVESVPTALSTRLVPYPQLDPDLRIFTRSA